MNKVVLIFCNLLFCSFVLLIDTSENVNISSVISKDAKVVINSTKEIRLGTGFRAVSGSAVRISSGP